MSPIDASPLGCELCWTTRPGLSRRSITAADGPADPSAPLAAAATLAASRSERRVRMFVKARPARPFVTPRMPAPRSRSLRTSAISPESSRSVSLWRRSTNTSAQPAPARCASRMTLLRSLRSTGGASRFIASPRRQLQVTAQPVRLDQRTTGRTVSSRSWSPVTGGGQRRRGVDPRCGRA